MAARHRIPTIFNLSMVDVLCCALGCVILLWLLNLKEAKQRAADAGQTSTWLAKTRQQLEDTDKRLQAASSQLESTTKEKDQGILRASAAEKVRDELQGNLAAAQLRLTELDKALAQLRGQYASSVDRLAKKTKEQTDLAKEMAAARQKISDLEFLVREKETQVKTVARSGEEMAEQLRDLDARLKQARAQADLVPGFRDKLAAAETAQAALQKEITDRKKDLAGAGMNQRTLEETTRRQEREIGTLRDEKRALSNQIQRARTETENRFAGIALTGKRVVFLIDMSGSMELVDENTPAPEKWTAVRQTLAKVMRSLPDLEKFQVILFANQATYLMGNQNSWFDFDPVTSTGKVAEALAAVKPRGNTDMYSAFEAAFRFRPAGLDTIYVFSDGLPNIGAGLSPEAARTLKETDRAEILSKHIRRMLLNQWNRKSGSQPQVRINTIGFFYESPDVGAFLWALARENDGSFVGMSKP